MTRFDRLLQDEDGATAIEYGLIASLIAVAILIALSTLGTSLETLFTNVSTDVDNAIN